jgi:hypothetical protein
MNQMRVEAYKSDAAWVKEVNGAQGEMNGWEGGGKPGQYCKVLVQ